MIKTQLPCVLRKNLKTLLRTTVKLARDSATAMFYSLK